ncbi:MAG: response regulator, partial [Candidatus Latescibacterota bacterium]
FILMDIKLPGMDGVETYRRIKKIPLAPVVVMMTAYAMDKLIVDALDEGARAILYKPLEIEEVLAHVNMVKKDRQRSRGESAR